MNMMTIVNLLKSVGLSCGCLCFIAISLHAQTTTMSGNYWFQNRVGVGDIINGAVFSVWAPDGADASDYIAKIYNWDATPGQSYGLQIKAGNDGSDIPLSIISRLDKPLLYVRGNGNVGVGISSPQAKLDVSQSSGGFALITGADATGDTRTNAVEKISRQGVQHYLNAEEPVTVIAASSGVDSNVVNIGGGTSAGNAATDIKFYTATDGATVSGTERMRVTGTGVIVTGAGVGGVNALEVNGVLKVNGLIIIPPAGNISMGEFTAP